jgi:hypothetical protein
MKNLPTAEEFLESQHKTVPNIEFDIRQVMIEFAKLHVEAALKEASENASVYADEGGYSEFVDEQSILNSYPLENIK